MLFGHLSSPAVGADNTVKQNSHYKSIKPTNFNIYVKFHQDILNSKQTIHHTSKTILCLWSYVHRPNARADNPTEYKNLGPVVQSIVRLKSSLIGQIVKCFTTLKPNILIFSVKTRALIFVRHT